MPTIGPLEYILIGFPDNKFTGGIAPALADLVENGTVRIIDLVFIQKDADGNVLSFEYDDLAETAAYADIEGDADGFLDEADILAAADELDLNSSALLIVWEDLWAAPLAKEILASGGQVIAGRRIPHQVVTEILELIEGNAS
jgi:Family of unknown function (DUF6325)